MEKNTRVIGIISGKGGVGKTTVVANLGAALAARFKKEVVIVDCNITTSHLSLSLGMYYCTITLNDALRGEKKIFEAMYDHPSGMKVVPASLSLRELERIDVSRLKDVIKDLNGKVDFILLDASPGLGREAYSSINASEELILVTNPNMPAAVDIVKCNEIIKNVNKKPIGIVLNMVDRKDYEMSKNDIEALTELPVIAVIPQDREVHRSLSKRTPVVMLKPNAKSSREFIRLAGWLIGEEQRGFFSRLFGHKK